MVKPKGRTVSLCGREGGGRTFQLIRKNHSREGRSGAGGLGSGRRMGSAHKFRQLGFKDGVRVSPPSSPCWVLQHLCPLGPQSPRNRRREMHRAPASGQSGPGLWATSKSSAKCSPRSSGSGSQGHLAKRNADVASCWEGGGRRTSGPGAAGKGLAPGW